MSDRSSQPMPDPGIRSAVLRALRVSEGRWRRVGSTGWGEAWALTAGDERHFVKLSSGSGAGMLDSEAEGLRALRGTDALRVPDVHAAGVAGSAAFLVLEWLDLRPLTDRAALGAALARLHKATPPQGRNGERFGFSRDNWIGGNPQANAWSDDWGAFFRDMRLRPQFERALANGFHDLAPHAERLLGKLPRLLAAHEPVPSLVHGDLWAGNAGALASGEPVVFDPAVYVGDAEVDLAMTELFGGFGPEFHAAYNAARPARPGYAARREIYNLYHLLNHLNLFGAAYLERTRRSVGRLLAQAD
jgi:protein-ribulosamine 3-kinase